MNQKQILTNTLLVLTAFGLMGSLGACGGCEEEIPPTTPLITFVAPDDNTTLTDADDADTGRDGLQFTVQVRVSSFDGRAGHLAIQVDEDNSTVTSVPVLVNGVYDFEDYDISTGPHTLTATLTEGESSAAIATISITVETGVVEPSLTIISPATDGTVFTGEDDLDEDPLNGFQTTVHVRAENMEAGGLVTLTVDSRDAGSALLDSEGLASFDSVTLPETGEDGETFIAASTDFEGTTYYATRTVSVNTGACIITVDPLPAGTECDFTTTSTDMGPGQAGFQTDLVVTTDCSEVTLTVNEVAYSLSTTEETATFRVTFEDGLNDVDVDVTDAGGDRTGSLAGLEYYVDTETPLINVTSPLSGQIRNSEDVDADTAGIQIYVEGTAAGVEVGSLIEAYIDDTLAGTDTIDSINEDFNIMLTFTESGTYSVDVVANDACDNPGAFPSIVLEVDTDVPTLVIDSPAPDSVFPAHLDADPDTGGYQIDFTVATTSISETTEVIVQCRLPGSPIYFEAGAEERGTADPFVIRGTVGSGERFCRARAVESGETVNSAEVALTIDTTAPIVVITEPEDGTYTRVGTTDIGAFIFSATATTEVTFEIAEGTGTVPMDLVEGAVYFTDAALLDGLNTITVTAIDSETESFGEDTVEVTYDTVAPVLTYVEPPDSITTLPDGDRVLHNRPTDDTGVFLYLYDLEISSNEALLNDEICLQLNNMGDHCETAIEDGGVWTATFADTFLLPGTNTLTASAYDLAGNFTTLPRGLSVTSTLPIMEIVSASWDTFTVGPPLDGAAIGTAELLTISVEYDLNLGDSVPVPADWWMELYREGEILLQTMPIPATVEGAAGTMEFVDIALGEGAHTLEARVGQFPPSSDPATYYGRSDEIDVLIDTTPPEISFLDLISGGTLTLGGGYTDKSAAPGFQAEIIVVVDGVENGQTVQLTVECGTLLEPMELEEIVAAASVPFEVTLPSEDYCDFTADVTDRALNPAQIVASSVLVDVSPPLIEFVDPPHPGEGEVLIVDRALDADTETDEIELNFHIRVTDGTGNLELADSTDFIGDPPGLGGGLTGVIEDDPTFVDFNGVLMPDGEIQVTATASDVNGNTTVAPIDLSVVSLDASLEFFGLPETEFFNESNDDDSLTPGLQVNISVTTSAPFPGETVYFCRQLPVDERPGPTVDHCDDAYEQLATATLSGTEEVSTATFYRVPLPEDSQTFYSILTLGGTHPRTGNQTYLVDTTLPTVVGWEILSDVGLDGLPADPDLLPPRLPDTGEGDNFLNADELQEPPRIQIRITFDGLDELSEESSFSVPVRVSSNASGTLFDDFISENSFSFTYWGVLAQGAHSLTVEAYDVNDNPLAPNTPKSIHVDTTAPVISWRPPVSTGWLLAEDDLELTAGAQFVVQVLSNAEPGRQVFITGDDFTLTSPAPEAFVIEALGLSVAGTGSVPTEETLGTPLTLTALVYDSAYNGGTAAQPVEIDVLAPTITLNRPTEPLVDNDSNPDNGYQVSITVDTAGALGEEITIYTVDGDTDPLALIGSAIVTGAATVVEVTFVSAGTFDVAGWVSDAAGNETKSGVLLDLTVNLPGCGLYFSQPSGATVFVNSDSTDGRISATLGVGHPTVEECRNGARVEVIIGCPVTSALVDCPGHRLFYAITALGNANFDDDEDDPLVPGAGLQFVEGEETTIYGRICTPASSETPCEDLPAEAEISVTGQRDVFVDLYDPTVEITSPEANDNLGQRLITSDAEWNEFGTEGTAVGPVYFTVDRIVNGTATLNYQGGEPLSYGWPLVEGQVNQVPILDNDSDDVVTRSIDNVHFPVQDVDLAGILLELTVEDGFGNETYTTVRINPDAAPPAAPSLTPEMLGSRTGRINLTWSTSGDDSTAGGWATRYEIRAFDETGNTRPEEGWEWETNIANWETNGLQIANLTTDAGGGPTEFPIESLEFDREWWLSIRAFDEAENWSAALRPQNVLEAFTRMRRAAIAYVESMGTLPTSMVNLGDVNSDSRDDLLIARFGGVTLRLGEVNPGSNSPAAIPVDNPPESTATDGGWGSSISPAGDADGDGRNDFLISNWGDATTYLFRGSDTLDDLAPASPAPFVTINGPAGETTEVSELREGWGNFVDMEGETAGPYDDFLMITGYAAGHFAAWVVTGRPTASWPATIQLSNDPDANCDNGIISLIFDDDPEDIGREGSWAYINGDGFIDLVVSSKYDDAATPSQQWIYLGGSNPCAGVGPYVQDLPDFEMTNAIGGPDHMPHMAMGVGEYAASVFPMDWIEIWGWPPEGSQLTWYSTVVDDPTEPALQFGFSTRFANVDADTGGLVDLVVGAPVVHWYQAPDDPDDDGAAYVFLAVDGDDRFYDTEVDAQVPFYRLDVSATERAAMFLGDNEDLDDWQPTYHYGFFVVSDFDYDGSEPVMTDVAIVDLTAADANVLLFY